MKNKRGLLYIVLMLVILLILCMFIFINSSNSNKVLNYLFFAFVIVVGLYVITLITNKEKNKKARFRDKLFNSLVKSSDTVYIMMDENRKVVYVSSNVSDVLGINKENKSDDQIVFEILNIPIIKSELKNLDIDKEYVSQMVSYDNPKYNHKMWIKVKMFPYKEKNNNYEVIQIVDASREHDRQHLLVSQASDIKNRESQLNQITSSSYDVELNVNIGNNTCDLKYFKKDNKYFGSERRGTYTECLKEIIEKYINENDKELFYSSLSLSNLKNHFVKYELDSIKFRYRIGNEVKNNTWLESTVFFLSSRGNNKVSILTKNVTEDAESIR